MIDDVLKEALKTLLIIVLGVLLVLCLFMSYANAATTSTQKHKNSLGVDIPYSNPYVYVMGSIQAGAIVGKGNKQFTVVEIQPYRTFELYTEELFLCGNQAEQFNGKTGAIVITYERKAHRMYEGVGCHELESIDTVESKGLPQ